VRDRLGSNRSGSTYFPYGEEQTTTGQEKDKFGTYYRDSSGLDYADQRYYANTLGQFLSPDPYKASAEAPDPGSWNRYTYVIGDPIGRFDSTGLDYQTDDFKKGDPRNVDPSGTSITVNGSLDPSDFNDIYGTGIPSIAYSTYYGPSLEWIYWKEAEARQARIDKCTFEVDVISRDIKAEMWKGFEDAININNVPGSPVGTKPPRLVQVLTLALQGSQNRALIGYATDAGLSAAGGAIFGAVAELVIGTSASIAAIPLGLFILKPLVSKLVDVSVDHYANMYHQICNSLTTLPQP
jgi:RHS repeat-associated protein